MEAEHREMHGGAAVDARAARGDRLQRQRGVLDGGAPAAVLLIGEHADDADLRHCLEERVRKDMIAVVLGPVAVVEAGTRRTNALDERSLLIGQVEVEHDIPPSWVNEADRTEHSRFRQRRR
jgi:hypothetical protein